MQNDAFTAGVEPGGLQSKDEIRILLCYLLTSVGVPLHKEAILQSVQANGLANYFEVTDALEALCENGNLTRGKGRRVLRNGAGPRDRPPARYGAAVFRAREGGRRGHRAARPGAP